MADNIQFEPVDFQPEHAGESIQFEPIQFESAQSDPEPTGLYKELKDRSFFDKPIATAQSISDDELKQIASKYGVSPIDLKEYVPFLGGKIAETDTNWWHPSEVTRGLSTVVNAFGLGIPRKLLKMAHSPNMERALDDLHNLSKGRESYVGFASELATPTALGTAVKAAGTALPVLNTAAGKIATGAGIAAISGAANADNGEEIKGAIAGGAFGWILGAASSRFGKKPPVQGPVQQKLATELEKIGADLEEKTKQALVSRAEANDILERKIILGEKTLTPSEAGVVGKGYFPKADPEEWAGGAEAILESKAIDLARDLTDKKPRGLDEAMNVLSTKAGEGEGYLANRFRLMNQEDMATQILAEEKPRFGRGDNFLNKTLNFVSDGQFVLRDIEDRSGLPVEAVHRDLNRNINRMSFPVLALKTELGNIFNANKGIDNELAGGGMNKVYKALDTGALEGLDEAELRAYNQFKQYFKNGLEFVNNAITKEEGGSIAPLNIAARENYVPHQMLPSNELYPIIKGKVGELLQETGAAKLDNLDGRALSSNQTAKELTGLMKSFGVTNIKNGTDLRAALYDMFETRTGRINMETVANAIEQRNGEIPGWALDTNLYRLANKWTDNTLKHVYLRNDIDKLASYGRQLQAAGDTNSANYIKNLVTDILGVRKGTAAEYARILGAEYNNKMDQLATTGAVGEAVSSAGKALPVILNEMNRQIYPNVLGMSARSLLMNATQPLVKTFPELGVTPYTTGVMTKALAGTYLALRPGGGFENLVNKIEEKGLSPSAFTTTFNQAIGDGIERSSAYAIPANLLKKLGDVGMYLYTQGDAINRVVTRTAAEYIAKDLVAGSSGAINVLNKLPAGVRKAVAQQGGNVEGIADAIASHLNASTQYNYNRASMSEFGRTMGPFFSMFSKWPTATAGEMIYEFRNKGALKGALRNGEKYLLPYLGLSAIDKLAYDNDPDQMSDRQKKLLGVGGFKQSAPIGSVEGILKGDFFTPPAVDAFVNTFIVPLVRQNAELETDTSPIQRGISSVINNFAPGAGVVRFLTDDMVTYLTGRRPEGETFLERTKTGARQLTK